MRKIENNRSLKVLSAAALGVVAITTPVMAVDLADGLTNTTTTVTEEDYQLLNNSTLNIEGAIINNSEDIKEISNKHFDSNILSVAIDSETAPKVKISLKGGLIYNTGDIEKIKNVTFNNNKITVNMNNTGNYDYLYGGIMYNNGHIGTMENVTFADNEITLHNPIYHTTMRGGLLYNEGTIEKLSGTFVRNSLYGPQIDDNAGTTKILGALINNKGEINYLKAEFIDNNKIQDAGKSGYQFDRGFVYNEGGIDNLDVIFTNNKSSLVTDKNDVWHSTFGALVIANGANSYINNINAELNNNITTIKSNGAVNYTGLIADVGSKGFKNIHINAFSNKSYAESNTGYAFSQGGIVYAEKEITSFTGNFDANIMQTHQQEDVVDGVSSSIRSIGGIMRSLSNVNYIEGNFKNNYVDAISNSADKTEASGGVFYFAKDANITNSYFISNKIYTESKNGTTTAKGGAIYSKGLLDIKNTKFTNNTAVIQSTSEDIEIQGGAIYSNSNLNIESDNGVTEFTGNKTIKNGEVDDNAIYLDNPDGSITFNQINKGVTILNDNIRGASTELVQTDGDGNELLDADGNKLTTTKNYSVNITGDNTGTFGMYNDIYNANVSMGNTTINTLNNLTHTYNFNSLTLTGNTNFIADVDLKNKQMDRFTAASYGEHHGNLNVVGMNLLSDATSDKTEVFFAEQGLKNNVTSNVSSLPNKQYQTAYTPIYKYNVTYNNKTDGGYFVFQRGSNGGNSSDAFNPSVLAPSVAAQAGATATMGQVFNYAFQNADNFMNIPYSERISIKNVNKYALSPTGDATDVGVFSPLFTNNESSSVWVKPYASFENVPLKNGPKVSNITYGTLIGYDTNLIPMKNGWDRVWTGYIGYNGASQRYSGIDSTQNGGLLGGILTLYKGNFFNATTVSAGANVANNQTMYGNENFTMLLVGLGNKTGYNFEFKEGKLILQPSMLMSYTFVNTFDYTNAAGVKMNSNPLHAIQLAPGLKLIGNLKNGWQPYASVNMVWNLLDKSDVRANDVKLPEMSIKPYIQYGVGVQKRFKDRCMAFGQAMIQNGGRNGIALTFGFRWSLGKEGKPIQKVQGCKKPHHG